MKILIKDKNNSYSIDHRYGRCLSIPYQYNGEQPNFYHAPKGKARPMNQDGFIGETSDGKGCNVVTIEQNIHCTGTHTECAGHILSDSISINDVLKHEYYYTELISVSPVSSEFCDENYHFPLKDRDKLITRTMINGKIPKNSQGLVIRTTPNSLSKMNKKYNSSNTPFFTTNAIQYINDIGIKHLVVDTPTIDRYSDGGILGNHHLFFEKKPPYKKTITEMAYIDDKIIDGSYIMTIEIPPMVLDAAPSRPFIFKLTGNNND
ncbi:MAG: hypothetical protein CMG22_01090 [Candidatus Marinimicrobia bacterium]|nr:hypothetical protein [Candidatus Neomarinimicrobiota bacterium]